MWRRRSCSRQEHDGKVELVLNTLSTLLVQDVSGVTRKDPLEAPPALELEPKKDDDKFNSFKSWYPVVPIEMLDPEVPHKFQILGMDIVV